MVVAEEGRVEGGAMSVFVNLILKIAAMFDSVKPTIIAMSTTRDKIASSGYGGANAPRPTTSSIMPSTGRCGCRGSRLTTFYRFNPGAFGRVR